MATFLNNFAGRKTSRTSIPNPKPTFTFGLPSDPSFPGPKPDFLQNPLFSEIPGRFSAYGMPPSFPQTPKRNYDAFLNEMFGSPGQLDETEYEFLPQYWNGSSFTFPWDMSGSMDYGVEMPQFYNDRFTSYRSAYPTMNRPWPPSSGSVYGFNFNLGDAADPAPFGYTFAREFRAFDGEQYTGSRQHYFDFFEGIGGSPFAHRASNVDGHTGYRSQAGSRPWTAASNAQFNDDHYDYDEARPSKRMKTDHGEKHRETYTPGYSGTRSSMGFAQPAGNWGRLWDNGKGTAWVRPQVNVGDDWGVFDMDDPDFEEKEREWERANGFGPEKKRKYKGEGTKERPWEL